MEKFKFLGKDKISRLPKSPGVYAFSARGRSAIGGKQGREFLYIGKATNIRERVKNHFPQPVYRDGLFTNQVQKVGYLKTNSEIEALILEADLIKKYQPKYNVVWRDDKNYFFVAITKEDFPCVFWTHQIKVKGQKLKVKSLFIGPFVEGTVLKQTLKILRKVFPYRTCKTLPKRPCLWYQLGRCPAPCLLKSPKDPAPNSEAGPTGQAKLAEQIPLAYLRMKKECQENVKNLIKILQGKKKLVLRNLKKEMKAASISQDFERAAKIRDQIMALERVLAHAKIFTEAEAVLKRPEKEWLSVQKILQNILKIRKKISRIEAYDVSNIQGQQATGSMVTFINGQADKNFYRKFKIKISGKPNDIAMIKEILRRRLRHPEWPYPDLILIDGGKAQLNVALQVLKKYQRKSALKSAKISVLALAKRKNELYLENRESPILLKNLPREIFNLILQLRDEAHRFAISYHRKLRRIDFQSRFR